MSDALKVRTSIKKRKPTYRRVQAHQFPKLKKKSYRAPKGMGNKVRRNRRGKPGTLKVGFGSPNEVKGANKKGLFEIIVNNTKDLSIIKEKNQVAKIGAGVGKKKKLEILEEAKKLKMNISNIKSIDEAIKSLKREPKKKEVKQTPKVEEKKETKEKPAEKVEKKETKRAEEDKSKNTSKPSARSGGKKE